MIDETEDIEPTLNRLQLAADRNHASALAWRRRADSLSGSLRKCRKTVSELRQETARIARACRARIQAGEVPPPKELEDEDEDEMRLIRGKVFGPDDDVTDSVVRGANYARVFALHANSAPDGSKSVALGAPRGLPPGIQLLVVGEVVGTDQAITMEARVNDLGSSTAPAQITVTAEAREMERVFLPGALQEFRWDLFVAPTRTALMRVHVHVEDSALGARR